ncbi:MAG: hypothetical protein KJO85_06090, partial [Gammaproteobacteria bacterium]|nr:hypothetical protein [Gammaproteobacteria bacterium]
VTNLQEFFRDSIRNAMVNQRVDADDHTAYYVVNLLTVFSRSDALYEQTQNGLGLKPLANMLCDAVEAESAEQRNVALKRLGDVSLFVAGFFYESLARSLVDVDYYVNMGGGAYGSLSENIRSSARGRVFRGVYSELADKFQSFVDVLNEVRDMAKGSSDHDVLRLYEIWLRTGSDRVAGLLRELGVEPNQLLDTRFKH